VWVRFGSFENQICDGMRGPLPNRRISAESAKIDAAVAAAAHSHVCKFEAP
jgi:hypothetical protein